jgi:hypothetical protein
VQFRIPEAVLPRNFGIFGQFDRTAKDTPAGIEKSKLKESAAWQPQDMPRSKHSPYCHQVRLGLGYKGIQFFETYSNLTSFDTPRLKSDALSVVEVYGDSWFTGIPYNYLSFRQYLNQIPVRLNLCIEPNLDRPRGLVSPSFRELLLLFPYALRYVALAR